MLAQVDIALLSQSGTVTQYIGKLRFALAYCNSLYVKTPQLSLITMMDSFVLLVLHTFNIATVSYTVTSMRDFFRFALAYCDSVYIRKTPQVSLSVIMDAFVLRVLHTFQYGNCRIL